MNSFTRAFYAALALLLLTSCATRIPVTKPDDLIWWVGKTVRFRPPSFYLAPNYAGANSAPYKGTSINMGSNYELQINSHTNCKIVKFYRTTESEGSRVCAVMHAVINGRLIEFEYMFIPNFHLPGKNDAEKLTHELLKPKNSTWILIN